MNDTTLFAFEDDFVATLRCIPMAVRFKLDACGVKLSLRQWSRLTHKSREALLARPCDRDSELQAYHDYLAELLRLQGDAETVCLPPNSTVPWALATHTPEAVKSFAASVRVVPPSDAEWSVLTPLQRFTLLKLSRDNHDNVNFLPALREFGRTQDFARPNEASYVASA